jgi:hypothetical protein
VRKIELPPGFELFANMLASPAKVKESPPGAVPRLQGAHSSPADTADSRQGPIMGNE